MSRIKQRGINGYIFIWIMLVISIFMFRYVREDLHLEQRETRDYYRMEYSNEVSFALSVEQAALGGLTKCFDNNVNISIVDISLFLDDTGYCYMSEIIISGDDYLYPLVKGSYPSESRLATGKPCAVLGKKLHRLTYKKDGKRYIKICGDEYEVTGYISMKESSILDHRLVLFNECLGKGVTDNLNYLADAMGLICIAGYNYGGQQDLENGLADVCQRYDNTMAYGDYHRFVESEKADKRYISYARLLFVFSLVTLIMFGSLWMLQYRREIVIRRAFGYSVFRILLGLAVRIIVLIIASIISTELIYIIIRYASSDLLIINKGSVCDAVVDYIYAGIIIITVLMVPITISVLKNNPHKLLLMKNK